MSLAISVDLSKVVLITNSSIAQSGVDALDYCARRGIPTTNILSFNFGTTNGFTTAAQLTTAATLSVQASGLSGYVGLSFCAAMAALVNTFKAQAIIFSTLTPTSTTALSVGDGMPLAAVASVAGDLTHQHPGNPTGGLTASVVAAAFSTTYGYAGSAPVGTEIWDYAPSDLWTAARSSVAVGRLGCAVNDMQNLPYDITEQSLASNTAQTVTSSGGTGRTVSTLYDHCVATAMAAEAVDNSSKLHIMSTTTMRGVSLPPVWQAVQMTRYAVAQGLNVCDLNASAPVIPGASALTYPGLWLTDLGLASKISPFAMTVPEANTNVMGNPVTVWYGSGGLPGYYANSGPNGFDNWTPLPGAWTYPLSSYTMFWARGFLSRGGAAAVTTVSEPLSDNLLNNMSLLRLLTMHRAPLCVAAWLATDNANSGLGVVVTGDPLYAPYKSSVLTKAYTFIDGSI